MGMPVPMQSGTATYSDMLFLGRRYNNDPKAEALEAAQKNFGDARDKLAMVALLLQIRRSIIT